MSSSSPPHLLLTKWLEMYQSRPPPDFQVELATPQQQQLSTQSTTLQNKLLLPSVSSITTTTPLFFTIIAGSNNLNNNSSPTILRSPSDFILLRTTLLHRFPNTVIALLPESHPGDFVKDRRRLSIKSADTYTHWLRCLSRHPFLSQDEVFLTFISPIGSSFKEALDVLLLSSNPSSLSRKSSLSSKILTSFRRQSLNPQQQTSPPQLQSSRELTQPTSPLDYYNLAIELSPTISNPEKATKDFLFEIDQIEKTIHTLKDGFRNLIIDKLEQLSNGHVEISKTFSTWLAFEYSSSSNSGNSFSSSSAAATTTTTSLPQLISHTSFCHESTSNKLNRLSSQINTLLGAIRFELLMLRAFKAQLIETSARLETLAKAERRLEQKNVELTNAENSARSERKEVDQFSYQDAQDEIFERKTRTARKARDDALEARDIALVHSTRLCKCTLNIEQQLYRSERVVRTERMLNEFAQIEMIFGNDLVRVWDSLRGNNGNSNSHQVISAPVPLQQFVQVQQQQQQQPAPSQTTHEALIRSGIIPTAMEVVVQGNSNDNGVGSMNNNNNATTNNDSSEFETENVIAEDDDNDNYDDDDNYGEDNTYMPWDTSQSWTPTDIREIKVAFDFEAEEDDELTVHVGELGLAGPFDVDRQWLMVKTQNGEGLVPTEFVLCKKVTTTTTQQQQPSNSSSGNTNTSTSNISTEQLQNELNTSLQQVENLQQELAVTRSTLDETKKENELLQNLLQEAKKEIMMLQSTVNSAAAAAVATTNNNSTATTTIPDAPTSSSQSTTSTVPTASTTASSLPPLEGWIISFDPRYNRHFYYNPITRQSVWKIPTTNSDETTTTTTTATIAAGGAVVTKSKKRPTQEQDNDN
jgi:hypothetical protein